MIFGALSRFSYDACYNIGYLFEYRNINKAKIHSKYPNQNIIHYL